MSAPAPSPTAAPARPAPVPADPGGPAAGTALQTLLVRPLILPLLLMLGVGVAVLVGVNRSAHARVLVTDSQTRLILISSLSSDISSMQTGTRGYVITGDPDFLTPYTEGRMKFAAHAYALHDLSPPAQQARLSNVQALVDRWIREAAEPQNRARRISLQAASALVSSGYGKSILDEARRALDDMQIEENTDLSAATASSQDTLNRVRLVTVSGLLLGVLLLLVTAWQVARTVTAMLNHLTEGTRQIAAGRYDLRLPDSGVRELTGLGRQVEVMAAAVQGREQELRVSNDKLGRSNRELEQFAYVASHDLQEPLRTIASYTELLARRYHGRLDERADQYIAFTTAATTRLKTLIQDLLVYSRVRQDGRPQAPTDMHALVAGVVADLAANVEAVGGRVVIGRLPTVQGNAELLRQVFQNLIGNALKFRAEGRAPVVEVRASRQGGGWAFSVQDNGIGIEPQYHDRIFGVFQRLHGVDEYDGSGIGLAVVRSAVEQHGGALWVESQPGQGSTFHFSLPDAAGTDPTPVPERLPGAAPHAATPAKEPA